MSALLSQDPQAIMKKAERFLQDQGITSLPVNPRFIAEKLGVVVRAKADSEPGVSGMLLRNGNEFGILYATHVPSEGFQNFSIAHELGHYLLDGHYENIFRDGTGVHASRAGFVSIERFETEADFFAAGLLMPDPMFTKALNREGDGLEGIIALAGLCRTSLTATAIRFVQKTSAPVAVVMSTGDQIDFFLMSEAMREFPDLSWPRKGEPLPKGVATVLFNQDPRNILNAKQEHNDENLQQWFGGSRRLEVVEEIIGLGRYEKTLTVITASNFADDEDED